jgi:hypothetical protein
LNETLHQLGAVLAELPGIHPLPPRSALGASADSWEVEILVDRTVPAMDSMNFIAAACWEVALGLAPCQRAPRLCLSLRTSDPTPPDDEFWISLSGDRLSVVLSGDEPPDDLVTCLESLREDLVAMR